MSKRVKSGSPLVAVAYLRASKDEQRLSPEAQRAAVEAWAAREGVQVAAYFIDQGVGQGAPPLRGVRPLWRHWRAFGSTGPACSWSRSGTASPANPP